MAHAAYLWAVPGAYPTCLRRIFRRLCGTSSSPSKTHTSGSFSTENRASSTANQAVTRSPFLVSPSLRLERYLERVSLGLNLRCQLNMCAFKRNDAAQAQVSRRRRAGLPRMDRSPTCTPEPLFSSGLGRLTPVMRGAMLGDTRRGYRLFTRDADSAADARGVTEPLFARCGPACFPPGKVVFSCFCFRAYDDPS